MGLIATMGAVASPLFLRKLRSTRVADAAPSLAPGYWHFSPSKSARLHRRVNGVLAMVNLCASTNSHRVPANQQVERFTRDLVQEALVLDDQVVATRHMARGIARRLLALIEPQVGHLEELAGRLAIMTGGSSRPGTASATALLAIDDRLSAMEAAHHEIIHLETLLTTSSDAPRSVAHGVTSPSPEPGQGEGPERKGDNRIDPQD